MILEIKHPLFPTPIEIDLGSDNNDEDEEIQVIIERGADGLTRYIPEVKEYD